MSLRPGQCVDASLITSRLDSRTIYANLLSQQQLLAEGKRSFIVYQGGGSSSSIVTNGFTLGALVTTVAQRDAILASVNGRLPAPPVLLSADAGDGQVALTWLPSAPNGSLPVTGYTVLVVSDDGTSTTIPVGILFGYVVTELTNGSPYTFSVYATNVAGNSEPSAPVTVTPGDTNLPVAPTGLRATAGDEQVLLEWNASISPDVTGYSVVYTDSSSPTTVPVGDVVAWTVTGLMNGTLYTFYVYATTAAGTNSQPSITVRTRPSTGIQGLQTIYGGGTQKIPLEGYYDGNGIYIYFNALQSLTFDSSGNLYVADTGNNRIRKIDLSGNVSTFAGDGSEEFADGQGTNAAFNNPQGLTFYSGSLYVTDYSNNRIRKIDSSGNVSTFAGDGSYGSADGEGTNASFQFPKDITFDSGNLYVADYNNDRIRKIDLSGNVSTFKLIDRPQSVTFDTSGNLYVTQYNWISKIDLSGNVSTFAGGESQGSADGQATSASFNDPRGLTFDSSGSLYVADRGNNRIRKIDLSGNVSTFAGGESQGFADGQGTNAAFYFPIGITFGSGSLYVADSNNDIIRKIDLSGNVTTLPGGACTVPRKSGDEIGVGTNVLFDGPSGILKTPNGLFIADSNNDSIKKIDSSGVVTRFVDSGLNLSSEFVVGMAFDSDAIYIADIFNYVIKKVDTSGNVTIFAGDLGNDGYEDGQGTNALFEKPCGITFDISRNLYITVDDTYVIRKIDPSGNVTTFAGDPSRDEGYEDAQGTNARFDDPQGLTFDSSGNLYVADADNSLIRKIDISGNVSTFAGNNTDDYIDAQGTNAAFSEPRDIAFYSGNLYVADTYNNLIRKIDMSGNVTSLVGGGPAGKNAGSIDGVGTNAMLYGPSALTVDAGVLYICDTYNNTIRSVNLNLNSDPRPTPPTGLSATAGNGQVTLTWNASIGVDLSGYTVVYTTSSDLTTVVVGNVLTSTVTGLTNGTSYTFYVYATNGAGWDSLDSDSVTVIPGTPSAPALVSALATDGQVALTWLASIGDVSGYTVVYSPGSPLPVGNVLTSTVTGLTNGTLYAFSVYATNGFGDGPSSASLTATPVASQTALQTIYGGGTQKFPVKGYCDGNGVYVQFSDPQDLTFDSSGSLYVADRMNHRIRKIDLSGNVSTFAGSSQGFADGEGTNASFEYPCGITVDSSGNLYISDTDNNRIRKIDSSGNVSTFAGDGSFGSADGEGTSATFDRPQGLTFDSGNLYVADTINNKIRKIDLSGNVSTFAGNGAYWYTDGQGTNAAFAYPQGLTFDSSGNLYVSDTHNNLIRKIDVSGNVSTFAGNSEGSADGEGTNAAFAYPRGLTFDSGNLYISDTDNHLIRKIDLSGNVSTFAGNGSQGYADGQGTNAAFAYPRGLTFDSFNNSLYVADTSNDIIRKIDSSGNVTTLPGGACSVPNEPGDGVDVGTNILFDKPTGILKTPNGLFIADSQNENEETNSIKKIDSSGVVTYFVTSELDMENTRVNGMASDASGTIYFADNRNHVIKKIDISGDVIIFAGEYENSGYEDGEGTNARFNNPCGLTFDSSGNLYVADEDNNVIRKIDPSGNVTTFAGDGSEDYADGQGTNAAFDNPRGITFDSGNLYVADTLNNLIRKIDMSGNVSTVAGSGSSGYADGEGTNAQFNYPEGIAFYSGNLYVADNDNNLIRKIDMSGNVTTFLGGGPAGKNRGSVDGVGTNAMLYEPTALTVDAGVLYICDTENNTIRSVNLNSDPRPTPPTGLSALPGDGQVTLIWNASIGDVSGYTVVYSPGSPLPVGNVLTSTVTGLTNGILYTFSVYATNGFGDGPSSASLTATPVASQTALQTIYGGGTQKIPVGGYYDGNGFFVQFYNPNNLILDSSGNLYIADTGNNRIRKIDSSGNVSTFAGDGSQRSADGEGTNAAFHAPSGITFDMSGNIYVADSNNNQIRKIDSSGNVSTFAGDGSFGSAEGQGTNAAFNNPQGLTFDSGSLYVADAYNNRIRKIDLSGNVSTFAGSSYGNADGEGATATFNSPRGIIFGSGSLYVADTGNNRIRMIDLSGNVSTFAGSSQGSADGEGTNAAFDRPRSLTFDSGNLYIADTQNNRIRKIDMSGNVSTVAGDGSYRFADGEGTNAAFDRPQGITFDSFNNNLYITDTFNDIIRKIDLSGNVTTLPGGACIVPNEYGDGVDVGTNVLFDKPTGILKTPNGLFIADGANQSIKKIDSSGVVTRFVDSDLSLADAYVVGMAFDSSDAIYIADTYNHVIKKVDTSGNVTIVAGDLGNSDYIDAQGTNAAFNKPCGITFDMSGSIYVADQYNYVIRKIDSSGNVSTFAGDGSYGSADGEGTNASFEYPQGLTVDSSGNLYVADYSASLIRKIDSSGNVSTFAGSGTGDYIDAQGTNAAFDEPYSIAFYSGNLYVADTYNNLIRKIDMSGNVTTFLGGGPAGKNAGSIDGVGTNVMLNGPIALTVDAGVLYICDTQNNTIRSISLIA